MAAINHQSLVHDKYRESNHGHEGHFQAKQKNCCDNLVTSGSIRQKDYISRFKSCRSVLLFFQVRTYMTFSEFSSSWEFGRSKWVNVGKLGNYYQIEELYYQLSYQYSRKLFVFQLAVSAPAAPLPLAV